MKKYFALTVCALITTLLLTTGFTWNSGGPGESTPTYVIDVADMGTVTTLGNYIGVEVTKLSTEVTEAELEEEIQSILAAYPQYVNVADRPAQLGDTLLIDYEGIMNGNAMEGGTAFGFSLTLGSGLFIDGFEDGLLGVNAGEVRNLNLTFPVTYSIKSLAGKDVVFVVTVHGIMKEKERVLDNDFIRSISEFDTVDAWKAGLLSELKDKKELRAEAQLEEDMLEAVLKNSEIQLNEVTVKQQYDIHISYLERMCQEYGMTLSEWITALGTTAEEYQETVISAIENQNKQVLLIAAIAEAEGLKSEISDYKALVMERIKAKAAIK